MATTTTEKRKLNLGWLTPPAKSVDGTMALVDHLKEFRYRVIISALGVILVTALCMVFYKQLYAVVMDPWAQARSIYLARNPEVDGSKIILSVANLTGGFMLILKVGGLFGLILSCPVWLYQLWSFIVPGLLVNEKKYARRFLGAAIPLFLAGVALGYWISPKGFAVLMQFNPQGVTNITDAAQYLSFVMRMLTVFGLSFLLPVVIVALNLVGVVKAKGLAKYRNLTIFGCFVFGAVATPSVDPFSMLALSLPMVVMYFVSEFICRANDRRRAERGDEFKVDLAESPAEVG